MRALILCALLGLIGCEQFEPQPFPRPAPWVPDDPPCPGPEPCPPKPKKPFRPN